MKFLSIQFVRLTFVVLWLGAGNAFAQEIRRALPVDPPVAATSPAATPRATPTPPLQVPIPPPSAVPAGVNDTAYFLAGLSVSEGSPLVPLTQDPAWQRHATFFDQAWEKLDARQLAGIRTWEASYLPDATQPMPVVFYMFSGPDLLYAEQFFPNASNYILAGTEPIGPLPDILRYAGPALDPVLQNLEKSLNSVLSFSFFITKEMKTDLQREDLKGTLPIFYVFLARSGKTITDITFITLDKSGQPHISEPGEKGKGLTPGVRITFRGAPDGAPQTLYYFTTDLSDEGIRSQPGFMKFCEGFGAGYSLLKSASYLMFENGFASVRNFLLNHSKVIVQDDSGIPIMAFDPAKWQLRFFGAYAGPIDIFKQHFQPQLQTLYQQIHPGPLGFGIGYRWSSRQSTLIVANRRGTEVSPLRSEQPLPPAPAPSPPPPAPSASPRLPRM